MAGVNWCGCWQRMMGLTMGDDAASFLAAFPAIQSAIKVYGDKQGMRVQLDIPESEMGEALKLLMWRERVLRVTVEPESGERPGKPRKIKF